MENEKRILGVAGSSAKGDQIAGRKKYHAPTLTVYGDIAELTQSGGSKVYDGGRGSGVTAPIRPTVTPITFH